MRYTYARRKHYHVTRSAVEGNGMGSASGGTTQEVAELAGALEERKKGVAESASG